MQTQVTLSIDNKIFDFAQSYAKQKGLSVNELLEYYIRIIMLNEQILPTTKSRISDTNFALRNNIGLKKTDWKAFNQRLAPICKPLPANFKFNRDEANER